ncbi:hypothetical protein ACQJBY_018061 [Aegilops geniculata]
MKNSVCHANHDVTARGRSTTMARATGVMTPKVGQRRLGARQRFCTDGTATGSAAAWRPGARTAGRGRGDVVEISGEAEVLFRWNGHQDEDVVDTRGEARFMVWWRH